MHSTRAAKHDVIGHNNFASEIVVDMSSIMLMRLQELCKNCAGLVGRPVILLHFGAKWHNSCVSILLILLQMGKLLY